MPDLNRDQCGAPDINREMCQEEECQKDCQKICQTSQGDREQACAMPYAAFATDTCKRKV